MDNPKAFPRESYGASNQPGMTLRDYFAGQALAGEFSIEGPCDIDDGAALVARAAYRIADAMLAERKSHEADRAFKEAGL